MSKALKYILDKFGLEVGTTLPLEIPNVGRDNLPFWLDELGFKTGVEVGVASGIYSHHLAVSAPSMQWWGVDPWIKLPGYTDYVKKSTFDKMEREAKSLLCKHDNYTIIQKTSMEALGDFKDDSLDFVYLDADHTYPSVLADLRGWTPKVRSGGIVAGHDYMRGPKMHHGRKIKFGVIQALREYTEENFINPYFVIGAEGKIPGTIRDSSRSWMFIKP